MEQPTVQPGSVVAPALAAGNTVVVKPPELTPFTSLRFAELALESVDARIGPGHASVMRSYLSIDGLHIFDGNYPAGTDLGKVIVTT